MSYSYSEKIVKEPFHELIRFNSLINQLINNMIENKIYESLTNHKVVMKATIMAFLVAFSALVIGYIIAAIFGTTGYNMIDNYISDMGNSEYTPFPYMRTIGNLISGPLFLPLTLYIRKQLFTQVQKYDEKKPHIINLAFIGMLMLFLGMMMTGIITLDVHKGVHILFAVGAVLGGLIATLSYGFVILRYKTDIHRSIGIYMIVFFPVVSLLFMMGFPSYIFYEWVLLFFFYSWMMLISIWLLKNKIKIGKSIN